MSPSPIRHVKQTYGFLSTQDYSFTFKRKGMQWTKSACLIELSASMKPLATYKVTEREGTEGAGRYGLAELVPSSREQERDVSLSLRPERSQAESSGYWRCCPRGWQVASPLLYQLHVKAALIPAEKSHLSNEVQ